MKFVMKRTSLLSRLGIAASVLLLSQQAFAVGTAAGTDINNRATVTYSVNTNPQTGIDSSPTGNSVPGAGADTTFVVDNRVDFTLITQDTTQVTVSPGDAAAATEYLLTNLGNNVQDFLLSATNLTTGSTDPFAGANDDTADMGPPDPVAYVDDGDGIWNPAADTGLFVDELLPDQSVVIWVSADANVSLVDGNVANVSNIATVADGNDPGNPGLATVQNNTSSDDPTLVDVVFANSVTPGGGLGDGTEEAQSGYIVQSAALLITKEVEVISDPFNDVTNPKAIPGAIVEYRVLVENTGAVDATDIVITDLIQATDVALQTGGYSGDDIQIAVSGGATTTCVADGDNSDGCTFGTPADTFVMGRPGAGGLTVPQTETATISYRVVILDPPVTP